MIGPIIAKAGTSLNYKTGSWRLGKKPKFLQINCTACKMCQLICPDSCITGEEKNTYTANYDYCKGCGLCAKVCHKKDIVMVPEQEKI